MDLDEHELDYLAQAHWHHFRYRYGEMVGLDRAAKEVLLAADLRRGRPARSRPRARFRYDTLVMAIGSVINDFGTPGVKEHAIALDTPDQAVRFHRRLVNACLRAHAQEGPVRPGQLHVAIIGAGATGTELSAELHRTARAVVAYGLDRMDPEKDIKITLIEAADRDPAGPAASGSRRPPLGLLRNLGVDVRTGARVSEVRADGVQLADGGFIPAELVVWAAGVKGPDILRELDGWRSAEATSSSCCRRCRPRATRTSSPSATAPGARAPGHDGPVPPRAQAAHQQASHLRAQIRRRLEGQPLRLSSTGTSARWCRSASTRRSAT